MKIFKYILAGVLLLCMGIFIYRFRLINSRYPNPEVISQDGDNCIYLDTYKVKLLDYEKTEIEELAARYPDSDYFKQEAAPDNDIINTWFLFKLQYTNTGDNDKILEIYNTTIENGNTTNGMDLMAFEELNEYDPFLQLPKDESVELILPFSIRNDDMNESEKIRLLFALYPQIICMDPG